MTGRTEKTLGKINELLKLKHDPQKKSRAHTKLLKILRANESKNDIEAVKIRREAVLALGKFGDTQAIEPLIRCLADGSYKVRENAAWALGRFGDKRAVEPLIKLLSHCDFTVRKEAVTALGKIGDNQAVDPLIELLLSGHKDAVYKYFSFDKYNRLRGGIVTSLAKIGDSNAIEPLIKCLSDREIGGFARRALEEWEDNKTIEPLIVCLLGASGTTLGLAAEALGKLGDKCAVEPLISRLISNDGFVDEKVVEALGEFEDKRAVEPLIHCLSYKGDWGRVYATQALGELGDKRAVEPLIDCLSDNDTSVRKEAARALGKLGDKRAVEALINCLVMLDKDVRKAASEALHILGETQWSKEVSGYDDIMRLAKTKDKRFVEPLAEYLSHDFGRRREHAALALGFLGDARALEHLFSILGNQAFESWHAQARASLNELLNSVGDVRAREMLKVYLFSGNPATRLIAAELFENLGESKWKSIITGDAADFIRLTKEDKNLFDTGIEALQRTVMEGSFDDSKAAVEVLITFARENPEIDIITSEIKSEVKNRHKDLHHSYGNITCAETHTDYGVANERMSFDLTDF